MGACAVPNMWELESESGVEMQGKPWLHVNIFVEFKSFRKSTPSQRSNGQENDDEILLTRSGKGFGENQHSKTKNEPLRSFPGYMYI